MALLASKQAGLLPSKQSGLLPSKQVAAAQTFWTPLTLGSALVAWWDPTQGFSLNGSNVASWTDRVGAVVASQTTASSQPAYSSTARNNSPGITLSNQVLRFIPGQNWPHGAVPLSIAVVGYVSPSVGQYDYRTAFGYGSNGGAVELGLGSNNIDVSNGASKDFKSSAAWAGADQIAVITYDGATVSVYGSGSSAGSGTLAIAPSLSTGIIGTGIQYPSDYWMGCVQDQILTSSVLTTSQRQKLEGYLAWKNNIVGLLPTSHPYKSRAPYVSDP